MASSEPPPEPPPKAGFDDGLDWRLGFCFCFIELDYRFLVIWIYDCG